MAISGAELPVRQWRPCARPAGVLQYRPTLWMPRVGIIGRPVGGFTPMPFYKDMPLVCRSCGDTFFFTAGEQEFYADKGFLNEPTRCPRCRSRRDAPNDRARTTRRDTQRDEDS